MAEKRVTGQQVELWSYVQRSCLEMVGGKVVEAFYLHRHDHPGVVRKASRRGVPVGHYERKDRGVTVTQEGRVLGVNHEPIFPGATRTFERGPR